MLSRREVRNKSRALLSLSCRKPGAVALCAITQGTWDAHHREPAWSFQVKEIPNPAINFRSSPPLSPDGLQVSTTTGTCERRPCRPGSELCHKQPVCQHIGYEYCNTRVASAALRTKEGPTPRGEPPRGLGRALHGGAGEKRALCRHRPGVTLTAAVCSDDRRTRQCLGAVCSGRRPLWVISDRERCASRLRALLRFRLCIGHPSGEGISTRATKAPDRARPGDDLPQLWTAYRILAGGPLLLFHADAMQKRAADAKASTAPASGQARVSLPFHAAETKIHTSA